MDIVAGGCPGAIRPGTAVLLNETDAVTTASHVDPIAIDFDIAGILDQDLITPQPDMPTIMSVAYENVVADDRVVADLMAYAGVRITDDNVVFVEGVDVVDVGPKTGTFIVVGVIVTHDQSIGIGKFGATSLPAGIDARPYAIPGDFVTFDKEVLAGAA